MKLMILMLGFCAMICHARSSDARDDNFEDRAYSELAKFFAVDLHTVRNQPELGRAMERLIVIGTSKSEALRALRALEVGKPKAIQLKWEVERNPCGLSVIYSEGAKGLSIQIAVVLDSDDRVARIRVGEFAF